MPALTARFRVLRYDTRGHGGSSASAGAYTLEQLADDAHDLFQALDIDCAHWVGLSLGSLIGQTFALKYPTKLQSLALAGTTSRYPPQAIKAFQERIQNVETGGMDVVTEATLERWFTEPFRKAHPRVMDDIARRIRTTPVAGYIGCCRAVSRINLTERLGEISRPTLVMVGAQDSGTPVAMARTIYHALPGAELVIVPSAAHLLNIEQPQAFNTALLSFLARTSGAR